MKGRRRKGGKGRAGEDVGGDDGGEDLERARGFIAVAQRTTIAAHQTTKQKPETLYRPTPDRASAASLPRLGRSSNGLTKRVRAGALLGSDSDLNFNLALLHTTAMVGPLLSAVCSTHSHPDSRRRSPQPVSRA